LLVPTDDATFGWVGVGVCVGGGVCFL